MLAGPSAFEQVLVLDINNGTRPSPADEQRTEAVAIRNQPLLVSVDERNRIIRSGREIRAVIAA
jgi:hypothetical protein